MENASKALIIAGSLLISVAILSLLVYTFSGIGGTEKRKDDIAQSKSLMDFNAEYEAFDKKLMYGVDVLSCINKAVSNNETAIEKKDIDALVDVKVEITTPLTEELRIYRKKGGHVVQIDEVDSSNRSSTDEKIFKDIESFSSSKKIGKLFTSVDWSNENVLTNFEQNKRVLDYVNKNNYHCTKEKNISNNNLLKNNGKEINESSDLLKLSYTQSEYTEDVDFYNSTSHNFDYCIKWTTVLSSFKKKTFKCEDIEYNDNNGRVKCITFVEK